MINKLLALVLVTALSPASAGMVLVLGDDQSEDDVVPYLTGLAHTVDNPDIYYDWDPGAGADLSAYDAVVMLYGYDYDYGLTTNASTAIVSYIAGGGHFIATSWVAYSHEDFAGDPLFDMTPVEYDDEGYDAVWDIDEGSPYFAGLTDGWSDGEGFEYLTITDASAISLGSNQYGEPLVVYTENAAGGRYTYLNHAMSYNNGSVSTEGLMLVGNAIVAADTIPEPSTFALLGFAGIAAMFIRRRDPRGGKVPSSHDPAC